MWWFLAHGIVDIVLAGIFRARCYGLENVPAQGPVIVAANHVSVLDGPLAALMISRTRRPFFMGKEELFRVPFIGTILRGIGAIPLDRGRGDVGALRRAEEQLKAGGCLLLFPEGTRSRDGKPGRPKPGIGYLAQRTGAMVVPARLLGTAEFPKKRLAVRFGPGMRFETGADAAGADLKRSYHDFAQKAMNEILKLEPAS